MTAQFYSWDPPCSTQNILYTLSKYPRCCVIENGEWRTIALSTQIEPDYIGFDWDQLPALPRTQKQFPSGELPPFLEGFLSIIGFDGKLHLWYSNCTVSHHIPTDKWYIWATPDEWETLHQLQWEAPPVFTSDQVVHYSSMSQDEYEKKVEDIINEIGQGNVYQINLSHRIGPYNIRNPVGIWYALTEQNPAHYGCYWQTPTEVLICNSPELFLQFDSEHGIKSIPIKGTNQNLGTPESHNELWSSEKEHSELTMIVDMMRNDISKVACIGSVFTESRRLRRCGDLLHAEQMVCGKLSTKHSIWQAVEACFPPASVTGAPKIAALKYIRELESVDREWYTGSFGWWDVRGHSQWNVLIRTLQCSSKQKDQSVVGYLNIGAGIVYDSNPKSEWEETMAKARAILELL